MEHTALVVEERKELKKGPAKRLRRADKIPAIVYGAKAPLPVTIDGFDFRKKFKVIQENMIIDLTCGKKKMQVFIKDYDQNIIDGQLIHIDFFEIEKGKMFKTRVPVTCIGVPAGVRDGGILEHKFNEIEIECLPKDMPESIELDISELGLGESIHVGALPQLKGVKYLVEESLTVVVVTHAKAEVVAEATDEEGVEGEGEEAAAENEAE